MNFLDISEAIFHFDQDLSINQNILFKIRLPKIISALLGGGALALCGLLMQVYFRNPLAGPFVLGVHSGASLFVALFLMAGKFLEGFIIPEIIQMGVVFFSIFGSGIVLFFLLYLNRFLKDKIVLLVVGLLFSHLSSGIINILVLKSSASEIKNYLMWTQGSFSRLSLEGVPFVFLIVLIGVFFSFRMRNILNILLMGENYAMSMGVPVIKVRWNMIMITAVLSGVITSFCGPISFVGILGPHIGRSIFKTNNHKILLPSCILIGSFLTLLVLFFVENILSIPINAVFGFLGAPMILYILLRRKSYE